MNFEKDLFKALTFRNSCNPLRFLSTYPLSTFSGITEMWGLSSLFTGMHQTRARPDRTIAQSAIDYEGIIKWRNMIITACGNAENDEAVDGDDME